LKLVIHRIDPHVHFRDEEQSYKETIAHGLSVAKEQGVEYVFDMPNTQRPILTKSDVERRLKLVPDSEKQRYFLYIGATSNPAQLKEAVSVVKNIREVVGIKMFAGKSTGDLAIVDEEDQKKVYRVLTEENYDGVLAVHCEKEILMNDLFNPKEPFTHALSRPNVTELGSIRDQLSFAKEAGFRGTLHICHVSCAGSVNIINEARKDKKTLFRITCGVTPHHLMLTDQRLKCEHGLLYKTNPPLRSKEDVLALHEHLRNNSIDWIETDHAPHAVGEKLYAGHPSGFPSLYTYKECIENFLPKLGLTKEQINALTFHNIVRTFKLELNKIKAESDNTIHNSHRGVKIQHKLTEKEELARARVCLPLDGLNTLEKLRERVEELSPVVGLFKIGKESFTRFGPEAVRLVHSYGSEVFLDLKYYDIQNTVKGAAKAATELGVYMFNVHASGGLDMMKAALEGAREAVQSSTANLRMPKIIAVTVLTSIDQRIMNDDLNVAGSVESQVLRLAQLTEKAGLDGVVCSAADLYAIKQHLPADFMYITPGIKGPNTPAGQDQKRVFTPGNAIQDGATILVIGRAITDPKTREERLKAGYEVLQDMAKWL
jgi:dihydroorotase